MTATAARPIFVAEAREAIEVTIGKDVLELLSSAMYVDPLSIYREYVQNAVDAIDDARRIGFLAAQEGTISIELDPTARRVRIRDDGVGLAVETAGPRLLAIGASAKRGSPARGFRGVGRLAGLGYCRRLAFRTRSVGDSEVVEMSWDCLKLKKLLRERHADDDLIWVIREIVEVRRVPGEGFPEHFFEVELADVVRSRNDILLNTSLLASYLAQIAPVPFHSDFPFAREITDFIGSRVSMGNVRLTLTGQVEPITRPHRAAIPALEGAGDHFTALDTFELAGVDGNVAAVGWLLHHAYRGALSERTLLRGLRLRAGNIQVGPSSILDEAFKEVRFNGWAVGEIHAIDPRIVPNGRRDHFEQNVHYTNITSQILPICRAIEKRCREASIERNRTRVFDRKAASTEQLIELAQRPEVTARKRKRLVAEATRAISEMEGLTRSPVVSDAARLTMEKRRQKLARAATKAQANGKWDDLLDRLSPRERKICEAVSEVLGGRLDERSASEVLESLRRRIDRAI